MDKDSRRRPKGLLGFVDRCEGAERGSIKQVFWEEHVGRGEQGDKVEMFKRTCALLVAASDGTGEAKSEGWSCTTSFHTAVYKMILWLQNSSLMGKTPRLFKPEIQQFFRTQNSSLLYSEAGREAWKSPFLSL